VKRKLLMAAANAMIDLSLWFYKLHKWAWRLRDKLWTMAMQPPDQEK
jgi:hypothetical protein